MAEDTKRLGVWTEVGCDEAGKSLRSIMAGVGVSGCDAKLSSGCE